jgi:site-specific DNA-cytosine methylase
MKILLACEESQAVTKELRLLGHEAYSCDLLKESGGHPEWHIQGDVLPVLKKDWDMIIAFPPCTHLANSGARWFDEKRKDGRQQEGIDFFMEFTKLNCPKVAIENPIGIMSSKYRKPDQIIQPYMFGDGYEKSTCLWLKGLPKLVATEIVKPEPRKEYANGKSLPTWYADAWKLSKEERAKVRSKTFNGIAKAMATQWTKEDAE